jgi:FtsH-binding integral membrane protein
LFLALVTNKWLFFGLLFAQLILVAVLSGFIMRMSYSTTIFLFFLYAFLMGLTLSSIFFIYQIQSIGLVFGITSGMFGLCALYGYFTDSDLSTMGSILTMALIGVIIAMIVNMFLHSSAFDYILSCICVVIFAGLTAYSVQNIKQLEWQCAGDRSLMKKMSISGALTLYLLFINLFLSLLDLFGQRKNQ